MFALTRIIGVILTVVLFSVPHAYGQFWDKLSNPKIAIRLNHPPRLGLNLKKVAMGPANGQCADEIVDRLSAKLVQGGMEVVDRQNLQSVLAEHRLSLSGYVDAASAAQLGKLLGPSALVFVKITRCHTEHKRTYKDRKTSQRIIRKHFAATEVHIRGTFQVVDLATARIFTASTLTTDRVQANTSDEGPPEFPSEDIVMDAAINGASFHAQTYLTPWWEQKAVYFFDDKDCNLNSAYAALKANDVAGALQKSEQNLTECKDSPKAKNGTLAHAYYNAGLSNLLVNEHTKAMAYLEESEKLKGGDIVAQTITEAQASAKLAQEMLRVEERTATFEQNQAAAKKREGAEGASAEAPKASSEPIEERLRKLESLFKKGLISKDEFDQKKTDLLKEI